MSRVSTLADELRILKDIVRSQSGVVSDLARMIAHHMSTSERLAKAETRLYEGKEGESTLRRRPKMEGSPDISFHEARETQISDALQRESITKHEAFLGKIVVLEETATRILKQASRESSSAARGYRGL